MKSTTAVAAIGIVLVLAGCGAPVNAAQSAATKPTAPITMTPTTTPTPTPTAPKVGTAADFVRIVRSIEPVRAAHNRNSDSTSTKWWKGMCSKWAKGEAAMVKKLSDGAWPTKTQPHVDALVVALSEDQVLYSGCVQDPQRFLDSEFTLEHWSAAKAASNRARTTLGLSIPSSGL